MSDNQIYGMIIKREKSSIMSCFYSIVYCGDRLSIVIE